MASLPLASASELRPGANGRRAAEFSTRRAVLLSPPCIFAPSLLSSRRNHSFSLLVSRAKSKSLQSELQKGTSKPNSAVVEEEEQEVEEELPWIQDKALDLVEFTGTVTQAIPGPRVGRSSLPWVVAIPLGYVVLTFLIAVVKSVRKFNSPKEKRRKLVNKNAMLCMSIDELFQTGRDAVKHSSLVDLMKKTGFAMDEILRKFIRFALNEKQFNPDLVLDLIHLRRVSMLDNGQVAEVLNEVSRRIVKDKGPVVMDASGFTEKGFKRKLAVQALFGKIFYLSELPGFCLKDSSLTVKEIFGVTDDDADSLRVHTLTESGVLDSLQEKVENPNPEGQSGSLDTENPKDGA